MDLLSTIIFIVSFSIPAYASIITLKYYLSAKSRFEDHYFLMMVLCVLFFYIGQTITLITGKINLDLVMYTQSMLAWAYWFLLIFLLKLNTFRRQETKRILFIFATLIVVLGSAHVGSMGNPHSLRPEILLAKMPMMMKLDYVLDKNFVNNLQVVKLLMIVIAVFLAWRYDRKFSWMSFGVSFIFVSESLTTINNTIMSFPNEIIYSWVQIFIILASVFIVICIREYFKKRVTIRGSW